MSKLFNTLLALLVSCLSFIAFGQSQPEVAFTIPQRDIIPEGITYDARQNTFYLGSIQGRKILKIEQNGKISEFVKSKQDDILEVLGMTVDASGRLWVCNNSPEYDSLTKVSNIHLYDLTTGKLIRIHTLRDNTKHLFNDIYVTSQGDAYITDSNVGAVYRISREDGELEPFIPAGTLRYPNGITATADEKKLFVSTSGGIMTIDIETRAVKPIRHAKSLVVALDGLYRYKNSLIGVQNVFFPEAILKLTLAEDENSFASIEFLANNHPKFDLPTTGTIAGNEFYFIANSQLLQIIGNKGQIKNPEKLNDTWIMKIRLN